MILPVVSVGNSVLRKKCKEVDEQHPGLDTLIDNMWDTLYAADGAGLAAPQVGMDLRIFLADSKTSYKYLDEDEREWFIGDKGITETFINPVITSRSQETWSDDEGCLSIPGIWDEVERPLTITIEYYDRNFEKQVKEYSGKTARVIQHEYDHLEGILFSDYLSPLKKRMINGRMRKISEGKVKTRYQMKYAV
ncbi:MAG TPA: peptide deformylase [Bacteroidales bacterium]|nr:peptide deformylase [Bacteroidales bacterium]